MLTRRMAVLGVFAVGSALIGPASTLARSRNKGTLQLLDTDNDGTVDLNEARTAASALFDKLDADHDGTLDRRELRRRINGKDFAAADPDKDGTLTKDEYLAVVEQRFKAADADNDGTLTARELATNSGRALLRMLI
jgi:Ca2+-binding EF-hand superfamily protein